MRRITNTNRKGEAFASVFSFPALFTGPDPSTLPAGIRRGAIWP